MLDRLCLDASVGLKSQEQHLYRDFVVLVVLGVSITGKSGVWLYGSSPVVEKQTG